MSREAEGEGVGGRTPSTWEDRQGMADPWVKGLRATVDENQGSKVKFRGVKGKEGMEPEICRVSGQR